jgi:hypothetical protein
MKNEVTSSFIFEEPTMPGDTLLTMIQNAALRHVPFGRVFQFDGGPPPISRRVRAFLDNEFSHRWIGKGGRIPWPSRSPDLTPMDFLVGVFKRHLL